MGVVLRNRFGCHWLASPPTKVREERRVVVLAEPRGRVAVVLQDGADGALLDRDDRVVTRVPRGDFAHHPEADRVMVSPGNDRRPRRRAQRRGMEIGVAQPALRDAIEGRGRDDAAEGARRAEAVIVGHDQQHVGRALGRHDARGPPGRRLRGLLLDHPAEFRVGRRQLLAAEGGSSAGRTRCAGYLLRCRRERCDSERRYERQERRRPRTHLSVLQSQSFFTIAASSFLISSGESCGRSSLMVSLLSFAVSLNGGL